MTRPCRTAAGLGLFRLASVIAACGKDEGGPADSGGEHELSEAFGKWSPSSWESCTKAINDGYSDDPRSTQNGLVREVYFNQTWITNAGGPQALYTGPFGEHASQASFQGSVRQTLAAIDTTRPWPLESPAFGSTRNYGGNGVHAPN